MRECLPVLEVARRCSELVDSRTNQNRMDDMHPNLRVHVWRVSPLVLQHSEGEQPRLNQDRGVEFAMTNLLVHAIVPSW